MILTNKQTRLTLVSSLLPQAAHCNTHVYFFMEATQDTHTHKHTNVRSAFHPSRTVLPPGPPRSSGQLLSARGPSEWIMFCFCMFFLLGFLLEETPCEHGENMQTACPV